MMRPTPIRAAAALLVRPSCPFAAGFVAAGLLASGGPVAAQDPGAEPTTQPEAVTDEGRQAALDLLEEVAEAYRVDHFRDVVEARTEDPLGGRDTTEYIIEFSTGTDARVEMTRMEAIALDEAVYLMDRRSPLAYVQYALDLDLVHTLRDPTGRNVFPLPHFELRRGGTREDLEAAVTKFVRPGRVTDVRTEQTEDGETMRVIDAEGEQGTMSILIDPETKFIEAMDVIQTPEQIGGRFVISLDYNPEVHSEGLPEPIEFDPGSRARVEDTSELRIESPVVGDRGRPLVSWTPDGEQIEIDFEPDTITVLVFWSTSGGFAARMLPQIDSVAQWADDRFGDDVIFRAVNVNEEGTREEQVARVRKFWDEGGYTFPTTIDRALLASYVYAIRYIPQIAIIGPDGEFAKFFYGPDEQLGRKLQLALLEIGARLEETDDDGEGGGG